ncbi:SEC-C motif-containing protein [Kineococcus xinjiangensis]|uniref:UPF0225 protein CLV92_11130 n=1 Tax=Kineococcus xinjiangensis TaxID=512762 RepID=A0A2S6IFY2_9ACTN|nr:YchJ family protein [Kineococcus xinjiangensis]PPK93113.1 SEC-C motif-containing protein [Kineococcus xinjiangensis]
MSGVEVPPGGGRSCPCGLGDPYAVCCGRLHAGEAQAATAELLMRSRFSAFAVGDGPYLLRTWHPSTRPAELDPDPDVSWVRLDVLGGSGGGFLDAEGVVEFRASYRSAEGRGVLHERSRFVKEGGRWLYVAALPR